MEDKWALKKNCFFFFLQKAFYCSLLLLSITNSINTSLKFYKKHDIYIYTTTTHLSLGENSKNINKNHIICKIGLCAKKTMFKKKKKKKNI